MKNWFSALTCLLVVGGISAHSLSKGKAFVYQYDAIALSGIPEVDSQYSVFGIKSDAIVQSVDNQKLMVELKSVQVAKGNKILHDLRPQNINLDYKQESFYNELNKPYLIQFHKDGAIEKYQFDQSDPEWSRNMKIGLGSILEVRKHNIDARELSNSNRNAKRQEVSTVVEVLEPTYIGNCMSLYDYQLLAKSQATQGQKMNITKIRDPRNCAERPFFAASTHRPFRCDDCQADDSHPLSKNVIYKYQVDLDESQDYIIQQAISDGVLRLAPFGQQADAVSVIHRRELQLKRTQASKADASRGNWQDDIPYSNLQTKTDAIQKVAENTVPSFYDVMCKNCGNKADKARELINKAAQLLESKPSSEELKKILDHTILIQRALATMKFDDFVTIAREVQDKYHQRKLFWDCVGITGTNPSIHAVIFASRNNILTRSETAKLLPTLAGHMLVPNTAIVDEVLQFCKNPSSARFGHMPRSNRMPEGEVTQEELTVACLLAAGSMVGKTCAGGAYEVPRASQNLCPDLKKQFYVSAFDWAIQNNDNEMVKIAAISGLGSTALPEMLTIIEPFVRARDDVSIAEQTKAIYALHPLAKKQPELVRELLTSVLFNSGENPEARTAAFDVLIASRPSRHLYEKIAMLTKYEQREDSDQTSDQRSDRTDEQILNAYICQAFRSLANATHPCLADASNHAAHALNLMNNDCGANSWAASQSIQEGLMKNLDVDSFLKFVTIGDAGSLVPERLYLKLEQLIANYRSTVYSLAVQANGTGNLVEALMGGAALLQNKPLKDRIQNLGRQIENMGLEQLSQKIGYLKREQPEFNAYIATRFMDFEQTLQQINREQLMKLFSSQGSDRQMQVKYDVHKTTMAADFIAIIPIDLGINVNIRVKAPVHLRMNVDLKVDNSQNSDQKSFDIDVKGQVNIAARLAITAGIIVPDKHELVGAGYDTEFTAAPLVNAKVNAQLGKQKVAIVVKPVTDSSSSNFEVMSFKTRPYTLIDPLLSFQPSDQTAKTIHRIQAQKQDIQLIKDTLSLKVRDESFWHNLGNILNSLKQKTKLALATSLWATQQWVRREYKLVWKQPTLPQADLKMEFQYKAAPSDPNRRVSSFAYVLWRQLFGLADVPDDCKFESSSNYNSGEKLGDSTESNEQQRSRRYSSESQQSQESQEKYHAKRRRSSEESSEESAQRKYYHARMRGSSEESSRDVQRKSSFFRRFYSDDFQPNFDLFDERQRFNGRWMGFKSENSNEDRSQRDSSESSSSSDESSKTTTSSRRDQTRRFSKSRSSEEGTQQSDYYLDYTHRSGAESLVIDQVKYDEGAATLNIYVEASLTGNSKRGFKTYIAATKYRQTRQTVLDAKITPLDDNAGQIICLRSMASSSKPPCFFGKYVPDMSNANLTSQTTLSWGQDCKSPNGYVELNMVARKSREQLNVRDSQKPSCYRQCQKDRAEGHHMSEACMQVVEDQSLLNQLQAKITYNNVPSALVNRSEQLQDLSIAAFYPYLSHNFVAKNQDKQIRIDVRYRYNAPAMDVTIQRPRETLQFTKVPFPKYLPSVIVPSVAKSRYQRFLEQKTDGAATPTCTVTNRFVDTFNNQSYRFQQRQSCEYLLAGDCSPSNMFSISLKDGNRDSRSNIKTLTATILKNVIEINPQDQSKTVVINGKPLTIADKQTIILSDKSNGPQLIAFMSISKPLYKLTLPFNRIGLIFDGENVKIQTSHLWRNELCGLCGRQDTRENEPYMGPDKCAYKTGNDFAQSYAFPSSSCQKPQVPSDVECNADTSFNHVPNKDSCYEDRHIVQQFRGGKICVSQDEHVMCKSECRVDQTMTKNVNFFCIHESDAQMEHVKKYNTWKSLISLRPKPDVKSAVEVPKKCVPKNA